MSWKSLLALLEYINLIIFIIIFFNTTNHCVTHDYVIVANSRVSRRDVCFFPLTAKLRNSLPPPIFPNSYDLSLLKRQIFRFLKKFCFLSLPLLLLYYLFSPFFTCPWRPGLDDHFRLWLDPYFSTTLMDRRCFMKKRRIFALGYWCQK